jgi:hypothetical protein
MGQFSRFRWILNDWHRLSLNTIDATLVFCFVVNDSNNLQPQVAK